MMTFLKFITDLNDGNWFLLRRLLTKRVRLQQCNPLLSFNDKNIQN